MWKRVELYKGTTLESFDEPARQITAVPDTAAVQLDMPVRAELGPILGREVLTPAEGTQTLARFADGRAAITRSKYGIGTDWVVGLFPGLEYSAPVRAAQYDMSRDQSQTLRQFITLPCQGRVRPVVDCDDSAVEGVLLRNRATGKLAVTLMNWTYRIADPKGSERDIKPAVELVPLGDLRVRIRGTDGISSLRSAATRRDPGRNLRGGCIDVHPTAVGRGGRAAARLIHYLASGV